MDNGWCCDGGKLPGGCLSGITGFRQTKGIKRFRCTQFDYDLMKNVLINIMIKIYQIIEEFICSETNIYQKYINIL